MRSQQQIEEALRANSAELRKAKREFDKHNERRIALWREARDLGISDVWIAKLYRVARVTVRETLRRRSA